MCMKCVCIPDGGKLEDAKFVCVEGNCSLCGMDKLWLKGVRNKILKSKYDNERKEWVYELNKDCKFATNEWLAEVEWRSYVANNGSACKRSSKASSHGTCT